MRYREPGRGAVDVEWAPTGCVETETWKSVAAPQQASQ